MTDEEHSRTLAAGVEFYAGLKKLLNKYGLPEENAASLVLVAVGAVMATTDMSLEQLCSAAQTLGGYWTTDPGSDLIGRAKFKITVSDRTN